MPTQPQVKRIPMNQVNLDKQGDPLVHIPSTRDKLRALCPSLVKDIKGNNYQQEYKLRKLCEQLNIRPVYLYEVR